MSLSGFGPVARVKGYVTVLSDEGGWDLSPLHVRCEDILHILQCIISTFVCSFIFLLTNLFSLIASSYMCHLTYSVPGLGSGLVSLCCLPCLHVDGVSSKLHPLYSPNDLTT